MKTAEEILRAALSKAFNSPLSDREWVKGLADGGDEIIKAMEAYAKVSQEDGWISVEDRLPEDGSQCLVSLQFKHSEPETICTLFDDGRFFNLEDKAHAFKNVTHWMPLPNPPKTK